MSEELDRLECVKEIKCDDMRYLQEQIWQMQQEYSRAQREYKEAFNAYRELLYKEWEGKT